MKKILINYADKAYIKSQKKNSSTGLKVGGFDRVIEYSPKDIDKIFYEKNKHLLIQKRGSGYWLWKSYIVLKTLNRKDIKNGDWILYTDSGSFFIENIDKVISNLPKEESIFLFGANVINKSWIKRDVYIGMEMDDKKYLNEEHAGSGVILIKKSKKAIFFLKIG